MTDEPSGLFDLARADLAAAHRDLDAGAPRHAASHAYYAAFHAASAALLVIGLSPKSHVGLRALFSKRFIKDGPLPPSRGRDFSRLARLRHDADYEVGRTVRHDDAERAIRDAAVIVDDLASWVEEQ